VQVSPSQFDVLGKGEIDEETEEVLRAPDPSRSLIRYGADGGEVLVHVRLNLPLLAVAAALPILRLDPRPRPDELAADGTLTPRGSIRSYTFVEQIGDDVVEQRCPAWYLAEQHGLGRRDFYFATQDVASFDRIARAAADAVGFPLSVEQHTLADVAPTILPTELIGDLGLDESIPVRTRRTRFEFCGAEDSLERLRRELEQRGYEYLGIEIAVRELRMAKEVPIDGPGFLAVLREIVPLARSLRCSYRGGETVGGFDQFALARPLPARYGGRGDGVRGTLRRLFGGSDR
jgi:hypothetical protein